MDKNKLRNFRCREKKKNFNLHCLNNLLTKGHQLCKERILQLDQIKKWLKTSNRTWQE